MTYAGLQLFVNNLKDLIHCKDNPLINNNPSILYERPQFQQLYEELSDMIQILFIDQDQGLKELEKVKNLKKRFKQAAEEAQDTIDLFLSYVHFRNKGHFNRFSVVKRSLNLEEVIRSFKSIKVEFTMITSNKIDSLKVCDQLKSMQPANAVAESSYTRKSLGMTKVLEETVVGFDHHAELIRDKLVEDRKQLDVISIVGMGGLGKTTLANKVFLDPYIMYHFHIRAWVTVSQSYNKQDFLIKILASIGVELDLEKVTNSRLREMLYKTLKGRRYLIVIDDIWSSKAWDEMKLFFPNDDKGSRILLTSRLTEVALHANLDGLIYHLQYLTEEESWELLKEKVFRGNECPTWLIEPGMQIARSCQGLPLAVVVISGILANEVMSKYFWEKIAQKVTSYIMHDHKGYLDTLALSVDHLPLHLRDCFLYLGGFPEDYKFLVRRLIWLWVAEGFIQEDGNRSLEEIAEDYLMDLVNRNLLIVSKRKFNGGVKACTVHDLVRELCLEMATKDNFCLKIHKPMSDHPVEVIMAHKQRHVFTYNDLNIINLCNPPIPTIRSLLCFHRNTSLIFNSDEYIHPYMLLMVLDLEKCFLDRKKFPEVIVLLVHLRYLAIWYPSRTFPSSICNLWNLQTLIVKTDFISLVLPSAISNLVNLRHLWSDGDIYFPPVQKPMRLKSISNVKLGDGAECWLKCFPGIKKLTCPVYTYEENDFKSLAYLQSMKLIGSGSRKKSMEIDFPKGEPIFQKNHFTLPATLKKLSLMWCRLPWSDISIIQLLPNLEELNLLENAFEGPQWDTGEKQFRQLKFLKLHNLDIQQWQASNINFPHLKRLVLLKCNYLEEIPLEIGDISTLELILTDDISSIVQSLDRIQEEQHNVGNYDLKIIVHRQSSQNHDVFHL